MAVDAWWRIDQAVKAAVEAMALADVNHVASQLYPDISALADAQLPAVIVCEDNVLPILAGRTSAADDWKYPVHLWLVDKDPAHSKKQVFLTVIRSLVEEFDRRKLAAVPEVQWCEADHGMTFDPTLPQYRHVVSGVTLWFRTSEER